MLSYMMFSPGVTWFLATLLILSISYSRRRESLFCRRVVGRLPQDGLGLLVHIRRRRQRERRLLLDGRPHRVVHVANSMRGLHDHDRLARRLLREREVARHLERGAGRRADHHPLELAR